MSSVSEVRNEQQVAEFVRERMFAKDRASRSLGMQITYMAPGAATLTMRVRADMLNGFDICHGGVVTMLADSAFAFACNSANEFTVASSLSIDFLAPAREGDLLTARAVQVAQAGRSGVCDVGVSNQHGEPVALCRGRSRRIEGRPSVTA